MRRALKAILAGASLAVLAGGAALASGGGGGGMPAGGGSGMPGASAPSYDPAAEYAKAITALKANNYKDADRAAGHVTEAVPTNPDGWRLLGAAKAGENDWKGSRRAYEKAVKLTPDDPGSHAGLGLALANLKDPKAQAEADWLKAKAQACGDSCPDAARLKTFSSAVESAMNPAAAGAPKPSAMLDRSLLFGGAKVGDAAYVQAVSLINERRYDEALASLASAQAAFGPHPDILTYEGYAWRKKGDYARAEAFYRQALAIAPNHIGATEYYGELKVARGDIAGARLMLARLDRICVYGCADAEELRRWIDAGGDPQKN
ncbi:tetratricopeptide repeat protein [Phenylobacterium sp.]|uniref:tetratricopeptide repeat protein n=1 Tax=Phenylobacterium sp. TaxID=1871053 RepID=UPI00122A2CD9|nr:tetratricopeptide repeat protein [Phenylobacterium sp.]THD64439.1 MAG: tetratricopeptide repeat protein [Phenylobacterium sp.]